MSTRASFSPSLATALLAAGAILLVLWLLDGRIPGVLRPGPPRFPRSDVARERPESPLGATGELAPSSEPRRTLVEPSSAPLEEPSASATLNGRLQVDGFAPYHGRVVIREVGRNRSWTGEIDRHGRFFMADVPAADLSLSFEMEWSAERHLLLPSIPVTPAARAIEVVDLDWTTRHVNVAVLEQDGAGSPARVDLQGPNYAASFDTNELGKARLSLIGSGNFTFRALLPSGSSGEAAVELHEGDELETVLIAATSGR